jgi:hypothetical protein
MNHSIARFFLHFHPKKGGGKGTNRSLTVVIYKQKLICSPEHLKIWSD